MSTAEWQGVSDMMQNQNRVKLGPKSVQQLIKTPERMLDYLSFYKFAAKMIGKHKQVLDIGCSEGLGTWILAVECGGHVQGLDIAQERIEQAKENWQDPRVQFLNQSFLTLQAPNSYDALVSFEVINTMQSECKTQWWKTVQTSLKHDGILLLGVTARPNQKTKQTVINQAFPTLEAEIHNYFEHVFIFSRYGETIQAGEAPNAPNYIYLASQKKQQL